MKRALSCYGIHRKNCLNYSHVMLPLYEQPIQHQHLPTILAHQKLLGNCCKKYKTAAYKFLRNTRKNFKKLDDGRD